MHGRYRPKYLPYPICLLCKEIMHMHAFQTTLQRQVVTESGCMCVGALCEQNGGRGGGSLSTFIHSLTHKNTGNTCFPKSTSTHSAIPVPVHPFFPLSRCVCFLPPPPLPPHPTSIRRLTRLIPGFRSVIITTNYIPFHPHPPSLFFILPPSSYSL